MEQANTPGDHVSKMKWMRVGDLRKALDGLSDDDYVAALSTGNLTIARDGNLISVIDFSQTGNSK